MVRDAWWRRYGLAVLAAGVASLLTWLFNDLIQQSIFIFYFAGVLFVSWTAGLGAGLLTTFLSIAIGRIFFLQQPALGESTLLNLIPASLFVSFSVAISLLSEKTRKARALVESRTRELLAEAERIGHMGSWEWDVVRNRVTWTDELYRIYGFEPGALEVSYERFLESVHPEDRERVHAAVQLSYSTGEPFEFRHRIIRADGVERSLGARGRVDRDAAGNVIRMFGTGQDITDWIKAEQAVLQLEREKAISAIVTSSRDSIIALDLDNIIRNWNRAAEGFYGYRAAEIIGQPVIVLVPEEERAVMLEVLERVKQGEAVELQQAVRLTKSGRRVTVAVSISPIRHGDLIVGVSKIDRDITAQKELERAQGMLLEATRRLGTTLDEKEALEEVVDLLVPGYGDNIVVHLENAEGVMEPVYYDHTDPARRPSIEALALEYPIIKQETRPLSLASGGQAQLFTDLGDEVRHAWARDERQFQLMKALGSRSLIVVPLVVRGNVIGTMALGSTRPDPYTESDLHYVEELGRRFAVAIDNARSYQAEHAARQQAEEANQAKFHFLTRMSHELRTPLNAIAGYAQLLEIGIHGSLNQQQRESIARIQHNQRHLLNLINDILSFAKIETGHVQYLITDFPVHEALAHVESLIGPLLPHRKIQYSYVAPTAALRARGDADKVGQIVLNLVSNAVKFTPPGGCISVNAKAESDWVHITVSDTGEGIPADKHEAIFQPFVQVDMGYTRTREGSGLGLSISRDLARGMGGDLLVDSDLGAGSTFTLVLPRALLD